MGFSRARIAGWASGFNWYKWGAIAALLIASHTFVYFKASRDAEVDCQKEKTVLAEKRAERIKADVTARVPVIQEQEQRSTEFREDVKYRGAKLNEAIRKNPNPNGCSLAPDELQYFRELAEKTRQ